MRIFLSLLLGFSSTLSSFAADNTELVDRELVTTPKYSYQTFQSCSEFESTMKKILLNATKNNYLERPVALEDMAVTNVATPSSVSPSSAGNSAKSSLSDSRTPHSETNSQVFWIDEADTVKTDGKYIYLYQETWEKAVIILDAKTLARVKTIRIPSNYSGVAMYLSKTKLILTATKYSNYDQKWYGWYTNTSKSIVALYDIKDPKKASLIRIVQVEGSLSDSRLTDDGILTAVVSTYYGMPPIYRPYAIGTTKWIPAYDFSPRTLIPRITDTSIQRWIAKTETKKVTDCSQMWFVLPSSDTLSQYNISPSMTSIIRFDTTTSMGMINSQVLLWDSWQIHLSKNSVYLTSNMWTPNGSSCPPNARCTMPIWNGGSSSTLVHRFLFDGPTSRYAYSSLLDGSPLTQYSMDEDGNKNFRVITSVSWDTRSTKLTILNPQGKVLSSLWNIAPDENFQSSRFIGDRLYLVTFEQIDPLFVIDLSNPKKPNILGELKMPGYSTYLHPYDTNRLIGIGYDTKTNSWWGTQTTGIKIDLYNVADVKNPRQEQSLILGDVGSSSDVLWNPRLFTYYKERGLLLLPGTFTKSANDPKDIYRLSDTYQWVVWISIQQSGITERFRVTHIKKPVDLEESWKKDCAQYARPTTPSCHAVIGWGEYCEWSTNYVPPYCYAGSTKDAYFAQNIWNYSNDFISRALYIGEEFYTLSPSWVARWTLSDTRAPLSTLKFKTQNPSGYPIWITEPVSNLVK